MSKGLSVSDVVNATIHLTQIASSRRNFGVHLILGASPVIDQKERIRFYSGIDEVTADFGTVCNEAKAAQYLYGQDPKPSTVAIGRWVREDAPAILRGAMLSTENKIPAKWSGIRHGGFTIVINGADKIITGLDFSAETNLNGVAKVISDAVHPSAECHFDGTRFVIQTVETGVGTGIGFATPPRDDATDISVMAALDTGQASCIPGMTAESAIDAVATMLDISSDWYGLLPAEPLTITESVEISNLIESQDSSTARMVGYTITNTNCRSSTNESHLGAVLKPLGFNRTFLLHSRTANAVASVFGRAATINFSAENSTLTMKFKKLPGIEPEILRKSEAKTLADNNINVFSAYQNGDSILQEGVMSGGAYFDEIHSLDWLQNTIQMAYWNLLLQCNKIGQDDDDMNIVVTAIEAGMTEARKNGLTAPGIWNAEGFGQLSHGDFLPKGYYVYAPPVADQLQSDREQRIAVPIQVAAKLKGAVHTSSVLINVNR